MSTESSKDKRPAVIHSERCWQDHVLYGQCFHEAETGVRVDPGDVGTVYNPAYEIEGIRSVIVDGRPWEHRTAGDG